MMHKELSNSDDLNKPKVLPQRGYRQLSILSLEEYIYTPFYQGCLIEGLDPTWMGSCNVLAYEWIYRKMSAEDILIPAIYKMDNPAARYPLIVGDNNPEGKCIASIKKALLHPKNSKKEFYESITWPLSLDFTNKRNSRVLTCIQSHNIVYGVIGVGIQFYYENNEIPLESGHAIGFAKRGDNIAWFDPNHGEIGFYHLADFERWLAFESSRGVSEFLLPNEEIPNLKGPRTNLDIFSKPIPTDEEIATAPFLKDLPNECKKSYVKAPISYKPTQLFIDYYHPVRELIFNPPEEIEFETPEPGHFSMEEKLAILKKAKELIEKVEYNSLGISFFGYPSIPHHIKTLRLILTNIPLEEKAIENIFEEFAKLAQEAIKTNPRRNIKVQQLYNDLFRMVYPLLSERELKLNKIA